MGEISLLCIEILSFLFAKWYIEMYEIIFFSMKSRCPMKNFVGLVAFPLSIDVRVRSKQSDLFLIEK